MPITSPTPGIIEAIRQHFRSGSSVAILHGISGSGKTQAAIDFLHHDSSEFENYIWLASGDWNPDLPLAALKRSRGGTPVNVVGMFNSAKTILVIDKLDRGIDPSAFGELAPGFARGGVVLVTSQVALPGAPGHLPMPAVTSDVAIRILGEDPSRASPGLGRFIAACRFSPLVLSTARRIIEAQRLAPDAFYDEILASPEALESEDGTSIVRTMLGKLESAPRGVDQDSPVWRDNPSRGLPGVFSWRPPEDEPAASGDPDCRSSPRGDVRPRFDLQGGAKRSRCR